jgi:hypothetical protein
MRRVTAGFQCTACSGGWKGDGTCAGIALCYRPRSAPAAAFSLLNGWRYPVFDHGLIPIGRANVARATIVFTSASGAGWTDSRAVSLPSCRARKGSGTWARTRTSARRSKRNWASRLDGQRRQRRERPPYRHRLIARRSWIPATAARWPTFSSGCARTPIPMRPPAEWFPSRHLCVHSRQMLASRGSPGVCWCRQAPRASEMPSCG